ncbi:MAG: DNA-processing protein DprA [Rhodocyclaceae bacterium]|nr:DNA-processing protein DprA [Rhodocyclaceae bacterium]
MLTAPLIVGGKSSTPELLKPSEYNNLAFHLREMKAQPADLISPDAINLIRACQTVVDENRLKQLLARGFLLSQAVERWHARAIWVVSRADADYPQRLKTQLREKSPALLYGCGDISLLDSGGLAIVGSRHVDDSLVNYTLEIGRLTARSGKALVSGGAKGIDQAAMRGALSAGGKVRGVLADGLEKMALEREYRNPLLNGQLVLISPYDPNAGFNVGHAMERNKFIYALADASLVVSSDVGKGGTWTGAVEQLNKQKSVPVYVRSTGEPSEGLEALLKKGAISWPNPQDVNSFEAVFDVVIPIPDASPQIALSLFSDNQPAKPAVSTQVLLEPVQVSQKGGELLATIAALPDERLTTVLAEEPITLKQECDVEIGNTNDLSKQTSASAEMLFAAVREAIRQILSNPMNDSEVAATLNVTTTQAKEWLKRLVDEGYLEKQKKPVAYIIKRKGALDLSDKSN